LQGNLDEIIGKMNDFNLASRKAHAEMLGLRYAEQGAPEGRSAGKPATRL
jgi:hypothetical protein